MKLLKLLVNFTVGTLVSVLGNKLFGFWGMLLGLIAGFIAAWWVERQMGL